MISNIQAPRTCDPTILEAGDKLRRLGYEALADELERGTKGAISEVEDVLHKHHFHRLANQLVGR